MPRKKSVEKTPDTTYVAYYRISTNSERQSLSLPYQKHSIEQFISRYGGNVVAEYQEEVTGTSNARSEFRQAVLKARETSSVLLVHKLSRLSRQGLRTIAYLEDMEVPYIEAVSPNDSEFVKGIKLLQAREENDERKANIRSGMAQIKRNIEEKGFHISKAGNKITSLGAPGNLSDAGRIKSGEIIRQRALDNPNNQRALGVIELMMKDNTYGSMANYLNEKGFCTATGAKFTPTAVRNVLKLYGKLPQRKTA